MSKRSQGFACACDCMCVCVCGISGRNSFKGGRMRHPGKSEFLKNGRTVKFDQNLEFF